MSHSIRSHQKSRKGCSSCKLRRVKCDEVKPQCAGCIRRGDECLYVAKVAAKRRTKSPVQPSPSIPEDRSDIQPMPCFQQLSEGPHYSAKHLLDLRLMHHYSVFTTHYFARTFPERVLLVFKVDIPRLAFEHEFLMDTILLVSMVHLGCTDPASLESLPVYLYRDQALRTLRRAVADISPQTIYVIRGASLLLTTVSFAADRITRQPGLWITNWLTLALGQRNFRTPANSHQHPALSPSQDEMQPPANLYGSFADVPASGAIATDTQRALSREEENDCAAHREVLHEAAVELGRLIAILEHPCEQLWLEKKIKAWAFDVVPTEFLELVRQARPQALIILAYYLAVFKLLPDTWTYQGVANHDIEEIHNTIDPTWVEYISVPKMALQVDDKTALAQLLVSCLPERGREAGPAEEQEELDQHLHGTL